MIKRRLHLLFMRKTSRRCFCGMAPVNPRDVPLPQKTEDKKNQFIETNRMQLVLNVFRSSLSMLKRDFRVLVGLSSPLMFTAGISYIARDFRLTVLNSQLIALFGPRWFCAHFVPHFPELVAQATLENGLEDQSQRLFAQRRAAAIEHLKRRAREVVAFDWEGLEQRVEAARSGETEVVEQLRQADKALTQHFFESWEGIYSKELGSRAMPVTDMEAWLRAMESPVSWQAYLFSLPSRVFALATRAHPSLDFLAFRAHTASALHLLPVKMGFLMLLERIRSEDAALRKGQQRIFGRVDAKILQRLLLQRCFEAGEPPNATLLLQHWFGEGETATTDVIAKLWLQLLRRDYLALLG